MLPDRADERRWAARQLHRRGVDLAIYYRHPRPGFYCRVVEGWRAA
jgi:hypothetical protein